MTKMQARARDSASHRRAGRLLHPHVVTNHATTVAAGPETVWPWLTRMGWYGAGWYTPAWVDRLLLQGNRPADHLIATGNWKTSRRAESTAASASAGTAARTGRLA